MNLPNKLTVLRCILTFVFIFFLLKHTTLCTFIAFVIFIIASITDYLDGYLARRDNLITDFGKIMDPIADKFLTLSAFYIFMDLNILVGWMFWIIFLREAGITVWRFWEMSQGRVVAADSLGKYKTVLQIASIIVTLIFLMFRQSHWPINYHGGISAAVIQILLFATFVLTVVSGLECLSANFKRK